jgi:hypothetical protein
MADNFQQIQATVRAWLAHKGADIVATATTDLGAIPGLFHDITGSTGISSFGTVSAGIWKIIKFEGTPVLTHNATSLILPGSANITAAVGDMLMAVSEGGGNWRVVWYTRGTDIFLPLSGGTLTGGLIGTTGTFSGAVSGTTGTFTGAVSGTTGTFTGAVSGTTGTFTGALNISGASAGQISFPATQNASADANTLDDYEEGTWTPSIGGTATYTTQLGYYTKIGRTVHIQLTLQINSIGTGSTTAISGLPFTSNATIGSSLACSQWSSSVGSFVLVAGSISVNSTIITMAGLTAAGTSFTPGVQTFFQNSTLVRLMGSYII